MTAVREHGHGVSVAEIAAAAGITKPVLYRHFDDRADLRRAVSRETAALLMSRITPALEQDATPVAQLHRVIDSFLAGIEDERELWRFVAHHQGERVADAHAEITRLLTPTIEARLLARGLDAGGAEAWAQGLVGMVQSAGDWWLERPTMTREALAGYLTAIIWGGLAQVVDGAPA